MGFRPKNRVYKLTWPYGHDLYGFEVTARAMRLGEILRLGGMAQQAKDDPATVERLVDEFAGVLVEWNREDENGHPVPADPTGLRQLEDWEFFEVLDGYVSAGTGVADPLAGGSPSGGRGASADTPPMDDL